MKEILFLIFKRLHPQYQIKNPVMFIAYVGSILVSLLGVVCVYQPEYGSALFTCSIAFWLWLTVLFSNFSEAIAESRAKAQAATLKKSREEINAKRIKNSDDRNIVLISATQLKKEDLIFIEAKDVVPADGQIIKGVASVDESAITGESAAVIREANSDRDSVIAGTILLSDWLVVRVTSNPGESFLDHMISLIEGAKRQKSPNEIALSILLSGISLIFLMSILTIYPFTWMGILQHTVSEKIRLSVLVALLVCLIPTTIGGLLSTIGIAGINRLFKNNVIANSGRAVEAAGDINTVLFDKTGTITVGNRQAIALYPSEGVRIDDFAQACELVSLADDTPEGRSIIELARKKYHIKSTSLIELNATFIPFSAESRLSGIQINGTTILKGAVDRIIKNIQEKGGEVNQGILKTINDIARQGGTPLLVCREEKLLGIVYLKDIIKPDIKARLAELRKMGVKSAMITGDNKITAATLANEAGVDDFYAEKTPEDKLQIIHELQEKGQLVAMVGDGTNDVPALAQTDVGIAMNTGTQAAKEAANMIDLDSDPTKLIEIVKIGKQLLITRGALTTFSISNDVSKYFAIIPAAFSDTIPQLKKFNFIHLHDSDSAILSAVIFNALIIIFLIPVALHGVAFKTSNANILLRRNIFIYGLGGAILPFIGIKMIDLLIGIIL